MLHLTYSYMLEVEIIVYKFTSSMRTSWWYPALWSRSDLGSRKFGKCCMNTLLKSNIASENKHPKRKAVSQPHFSGAMLVLGSATQNLQIQLTSRKKHIQTVPVLNTCSSVRRPSTSGFELLCGREQKLRIWKSKPTKSHLGNQSRQHLGTIKLLHVFFSDNKNDGALEAIGIYLNRIDLRSNPKGSRYPPSQDARGNPKNRRFWISPLKIRRGVFKDF